MEPSDQKWEHCDDKVDAVLMEDVVDVSVPHSFLSLIAPLRLDTVQTFSKGILLFVMIRDHRPFLASMYIRIQRLLRVVYLMNWNANSQATIVNTAAVENLLITFFN